MVWARVGGNRRSGKLRAVGFESLNCFSRTQEKAGFPKRRETGSQAFCLSSRTSDQVNIRAATSGRPEGFDGDDARFPFDVQTVRGEFHFRTLRLPDEGFRGLGEVGNDALIHVTVPGA